MRILVDLQGCQTKLYPDETSQFNLKLILSMLQCGYPAQIFIALNNQAPRNLNYLYHLFSEVLPKEQIILFNVVHEGHENDALEGWHWQANGLLTGRLLESYQPDLIYVPHMLASLENPLVAPQMSSGKPLVAVNFFDLVPFPEACLGLAPIQRNRYFRQLKFIKQADMIFVSSARLRQECIDKLRLMAHQVVDLDLIVQKNHSLLSVSHEKIENTADLMLAQWFKLYQKNNEQDRPVLSKKLKLAWIAPSLPFSKEADFLLTEISKFYTITIISPLSFTHGPYFSVNYDYQDQTSFETRIEQFDRVVYQIGPDGQNDFIFKQMGLFPGLVILHQADIEEFIQTWAQIQNYQQTLYTEHGYKAIVFLKQYGEAATFEQFPCRTSLYLNDQDILCHRPSLSNVLAPDWSPLTADHNFLKKIKSACVETILESHAHQSIGNSYYQAIEHFYAEGLQDCQQRLRDEIYQIQEFQTDHGAFLKKIDQLIVENFTQSHKPRRPQLLIDISTIIMGDGKSGIQRVIRGVLKHCLGKKWTDYRIEPSYFDQQGQYRYARQWTFNILGGTTSLEDPLVSFQDNDRVLYIDLFANVHFVKNQVEALSARQIKIYCVMYDLFPLKHPEWFQPKLADDFKTWLMAMFHCATGLVCISKTVAFEVWQHFQQSNIKRKDEIKIGHIYLGCDIENTASLKGSINHNEEILKIYKERPTFLQVSSLSPRKGHIQTLAAFDELWQENIDVNLVFIGFPYFNLLGPWLDGLDSHPERNKRFFWFQELSDELLIKSYQATTAVIVPSEAEGFGIPLVEAARYHVPIIARDIPIFREIAGDYAYYFSGNTPSELARTIKKWLVLYQDQQIPNSALVHCQTWAETGEQLLNLILKNNWGLINTGVLF